jgi:hypothetical protein
VNDALEIGFWRQRHARVERALALADRLVNETSSDATLWHDLGAALAEIRSFDAESWPWQPAGGRRATTAASAADAR